MESIAALALGIVLGFLTGGITSAMSFMMIGLIQFVLVMQIIMIAKNKGFLPLFFNLREEKGIKKEKFITFPDKFGRLRVLIMDIKHDGICGKKGLGIIDDKGTEYAWGNSPFSFGEPRMGVSVDVLAAMYIQQCRFEWLKKKKDKKVSADDMHTDEIDDYDAMIREYLGETKYVEFCNRFRKNREPDIYEINEEIQYLIDQETVENPFKTIVFGATWGFKDFLRYLKYAYHPQAMENAVDTEKIWTKREQMGYHNTNKAIEWAKAIILIIIELIILFTILSSLNLSNIGKLFGG